jgi:tol-pal system protein YbgF
MTLTRLSAVLFIGAGMALAPLPLFLAPSSALAQNGAPGAAPSANPGPGPVGAAPAAKPRPAAAAKPAPKPAATDGAEPAKADGSAQLRQRIEQLEEQINEMHVAVGTLDSLAKSGAGRASSTPSASGGGGGAVPGDAGARLDGMENRLRALSGQIEQMAQQIRALEGARGGRSPQDRSEAAPASPPSIPQAPVRTAEVRPSDTMVEPAERGPDAIGGLIRGPGSDRSADVGSAPLPPIAASAPPRQQPASLTTGNPRETYDRAYGSLLKQDYASAEIGFAEFLAQNPSHELSGNAQYWLGESFYVRGQYRPAANAFLKGYQTYAKSQKAPDSLLKLGMSLDKLGQRDAACSSIGELATRFPTAPAHIQSRAQSERARLGC